jgi:transcriptional regulator with XRE-family HTH domain
MLNLKELRKKKELTQQDLADLINVHRVTIAEYESNRVEPTLDKIIKISKALDITPNDLIGYNEVYKSFTDYLMSLKKPDSKV